MVKSVMQKEIVDEAKKALSTLELQRLYVMQERLVERWKEVSSQIRKLKKKLK